MKTNYEIINATQISELKIFEKYRHLLYEDYKNLFNVEDIIVCKDDEINFYLELIKLETQNIYITEGNFTLKVNDKLLIIKENFKKNLKEYCTQFLMKIRNITKIDNRSGTPGNQYMNEITSEDLLKLFFFMNFILFFSPEFYTIYKMKKEILKKISSRGHEKLLLDNIISEFKFVNFINASNRKCSVSWEYRLYLVKNYPHCLIETEDINEKFSILENLKLYIEIFEIHLDKIGILLIKDLQSLDFINEKEKRNYHLWKYLVHIFNLYMYSNMESLLILSFCIYNFLKDTLDYSAFSAMTNFYNKLKQVITEKSADDLRKYIHKLINALPEKKNDYVFKFLNQI